MRKRPGSSRPWPLSKHEPVNHRRFQGEFRWEQVELLAYKQSPEANPPSPSSGAAGASPFADVTRQVLLEDPDLACQLRYFEVGPGGHSTLERHQHVHGVMVVRGRGRALVGQEVFELATHDLVTVPASTWHQFQAGDDAPLGFLCLVNADRDRPVLPSPDDLVALHTNPQVAAFIRV